MSLFEKSRHKINPFICHGWFHALCVTTVNPAPPTLPSVCIPRHNHHPSFRPPVPTPAPDPPRFVKIVKQLLAPRWRYLRAHPDASVCPLWWRWRQRLLSASSHHHQHHHQYLPSIPFFFAPTPLSSHTNSGCAALTWWLKRTICNVSGAPLQSTTRGIMCLNRRLKPRSCPACQTNREHRGGGGGGGGVVGPARTNKRTQRRHVRALVPPTPPHPTTSNQLVNQLAGLHSARGHHEAD